MTRLASSSRIRFLTAFFTLNLAFWETVFGNGQSNNKVKKAVKKLDSVIAFDEVSE